MRFFFLITLLFLLQATYGKKYIQPEPDGRSYFAVAMANALREHCKMCAGSEESFTISPAAAQKMLAILYNAVEDNNDLLDIMLLEMGLKYFDATRLMETAMREMTSFDVLKEERLDKLDKPIKREDVLNYFSNDFNELGEEISFENYIIAPVSVGLKNDFKNFAKTFFNTTLEYDNTEAAPIVEIYRKFELSAKKLKLKSMDLFSEISFKSMWKMVFVQSNDVLETRGEFRYGEIMSAEDHHLGVQILELPLESKIDLNILLVTPKHGVDLNYTTSYDIVRTITDPQSISDALKMQHVNIKMSNIFKFRTKTDLVPYFAKNGLTNAGIFKKEQPLCRMFSYATCLGMPNSINQLINIELEPHVVKELPTQHVGFLQSLKDKIIDFTQTITFDLTEKPFMFIIKSKEVIYFMGHYYGKEN